MSMVSKKLPNSMLGPQLKHGRFRTISNALQKELSQTTEVDSAVCRPATMRSTDALISAILEGDFAEVERLVKNGHTSEADAALFTPLMAAAYAGRFKAARLLLAEKVNPI